MYSLKHELKSYQKSALCLPEELPMIDRVLDLLDTQNDPFGRPDGGHVTASVWIVNAKKTHALLTHHKKLNSWFQLGGHADGDTNTVSVAQKEAWEESGISGLKLMMPTIFDVDVHAIPNACAYHHDIRYLLQAPEDATFAVSDESHALEWVPMSEIHKYSSERSVLRLAEKFESLKL